MLLSSLDASRERLHRTGVLRSQIVSNEVQAILTTFREVTGDPTPFAGAVKQLMRDREDIDLRLFALESLLSDVLEVIDPIRYPYLTARINTAMNKVA